MRLYKAFLHLYPASFRKEYEEELVHIFRERRTQAYNPFSIAYLWLSGFVDVVVNAAYAHCEILRQDLRYTARTLRRAPVFALTAIVITGLGIVQILRPFRSQTVCCCVLFRFRIPIGWCNCGSAILHTRVSNYPHPIFMIGAD